MQIPITKLVINFATISEIDVFGSNNVASLLKGIKMLNVVMIMQDLKKNSLK